MALSIAAAQRSMSQTRHSLLAFAALPQLPSPKKDASAVPTDCAGSGTAEVAAHVEMVQHLLCTMLLPLAVGAARDLQSNIRLFERTELTFVDNLPEIGARLKRHADRAAGLHELHTRLGVYVGCVLAGLVAPLRQEMQRQQREQRVAKVVSGVKLAACVAGGAALAYTSSALLFAAGASLSSGMASARASLGASRAARSAWFGWRATRHAATARAATAAATAAFVAAAGQGAMYVASSEGMKEALTKAVEEVRALGNVKKAIEELTEQGAELEAMRAELAGLQASVHGLTGTLGTLAASLAGVASLDQRCTARKLYRELHGEAELLSQACESFIYRAQALAADCATTDTLSPRAAELLHRWMAQQSDVLRRCAGAARLLATG